MNPVIPDRVSTELYDKSIGMINREPERFSLSYKTRIIHLIDSVSRGYTSPMEAHEALEAGHFPAVLEMRTSMYAHLLR